MNNEQAPTQTSEILTDDNARNNVVTLLYSVLAPALLACFFVLLILFAFYWYRGDNGMREIATVDLLLLVEENQAQAFAMLGNGTNVLTEEQRAKLEDSSANFAIRLSSAVEQLGEECQCVIVNKAAILGGVAVDYTDLIRERIKK